jgi:hypothetical protein
MPGCIKTLPPGEKEKIGTGKLLPPDPTPAHPVVISVVPGADAPLNQLQQYQLPVQVQE